MKFHSAWAAKALALVLGLNLAAPAIDAAIRTRVVTWGNTNWWADSPPPADLANAIAIAGSSVDDLALQADGSVVAWGQDYFGQTNIPPGLTNVVAISSGGFAEHILALKSDGTLVTWGLNDYGQAIDPPGLTDVVAISAGLTHNLALRADGKVIAWGLNDFGDGAVPTSLSNVVAVAAGRYHSLALKADGTVVGWGANGTVECGDGSGACNAGETQVPVGLSDVMAIAAGNGVSLAVKADGTLVAWGGYYEPLGGITPAKVPEGLTNVVAVSASEFFCLALKADGTVLAFGDPIRGNDYGQMNVPEELRNVVAIAAGGQHSLALVSDEPQVVRPPITNPRWNLSGFSISLGTQIGRVFRLEYKASLSDPNWTPLPLIAGSGGVLTPTDSTADGSQRFYRVRRW